MLIKETFIQDKMSTKNFNLITLTSIIIREIFEHIFDSYEQSTFPA